MAKKISVIPAKSYRLSEKSIRSGNEFAEANRAFSLLYGRFSQVMDLHWDRQRINRFKKIVLNTIRSGPAELVGNRKLWDGDLRVLGKLQLNYKSSASRLFRQQVSVQTGDENIAVSIDPFNYIDAFPREHQNNSAAEISLYFFSFDFDRYTSSGRSMVLIRQEKYKDLKEAATCSYPLPDDQLTLLILKVRFLRGAEFTPVMDRQYIGADILTAVYKKNGKLQEYQAEAVPFEKKQNADVGEWEVL